MFYIFHIIYLFYVNIKAIPTTNNININQTLEVKGATDQVTSSMITTAMDSWWDEKVKDPSRMNKLIEGIDKASTSNGMAK